MAKNMERSERPRRTAARFDWRRFTGYGTCALWQRQPVDVATTVKPMSHHVGRIGRANPNGPELILCVPVGDKEGSVRLRCGLQRRQRLTDGVNWPVMPAYPEAVQFVECREDLPVRSGSNIATNAVLVGVTLGFQ